MIIESEGVGFSVQTVADRAGVSHRTVYNHFPTREALCDAFMDYVDDLLASSGFMPLTLSVNALPSTVNALYGGLERRDRYVRASVLLQIANRRPLSTWRNRTKTLEKSVARELVGRTPLTARQLTAALRMFASSMGWHLLTEQYGLSTSQAAATSEWATRALLDAAISGETEDRPSRQKQKSNRSTTRRRSQEPS